MGELKKTYRKAAGIWGAMAFAVLACALVIEILKLDPDFLEGAPPPQDFAAIKYALLGLSILDFFLIFLLRRPILFPKEKLKGKDAAPAFPPVTARLFIYAIVAGSVSLSPAVTGLAVFFVTKSSFDFFLFMGLSLALFALFLPRYSQWEEWAAKMERAQGQGI